MTLKFIGEKPDAAVAEIEKVLGSVTAESFEISFRGYGFFPTEKAARVFWVGIEADAKLAELAATVEGKLAGIGIPKEERGFSPHLTLARGGARIGSGSGAPGRRTGDRINQRFVKLQEKLKERAGVGVWYDGGPRVLFVSQPVVAEGVAVFEDCAVWVEVSDMRELLISAGIGYLLGSIPFGYLLVKTFRGADVRTTGSGNIGATNVARTSPALGIVTLALDALKGAVAVFLVSRIFPGESVLPFVAALAAVAGHIFPVWLRFRGGKGVATGLGSFLLLTPKAILLTLAIFVALAAAFRLVALASIVATASLPLLALWFGESGRPVLLIAAASLLIILKHHQNIGRMLRGTEPRFQFRHT